LWLIKNVKNTHVLLHLNLKKNILLKIIISNYFNLENIIKIGFWNRNHQAPKPWDGESRSRVVHGYDDYEQQLPVAVQDESVQATGEFKMSKLMKPGI
jgi:hypothetical protein